MSQNDYDVANQNGAAFRADVNNALQASQTQNSGSSAPSTTYAYQLWADTASGLLKQRNGANSDWLILGPLAALMPRRGYLWGMTLANNSTDATNDIDIATGECADSTGATVIRSTASMTKRLDAAWSAGTGNGGLDTGAIANTTYHVYAIQKDSDGSTDFLFSANASAPTMPSGYTYFRRLGSIVRSGGAILPFVQDGDSFSLATPVLDYTGTSLGTSAVSATLGSLPNGVRVKARMSISLADTAATEQAYLSDLSTADLVPSALASPGATIRPPAIGAFAVGYAEVHTNTSRQIRVRMLSGGASSTLRLITLGWIDTRGRT